jgi:hypothetical protein
MKKVKALWLCVSLVGIVYSQEFQTIKLVVNFEKDQHHLKDEEKQKIIAFCKELENRYLRIVYIKGHTDKDGGDGYNQNLSEKRSQFVENLLLSKAINQNKIHKLSMGERNILIKEYSEEQKALNRRVEIEAKYLLARNLDELVNEISQVENQKFVDSAHSHIVVKGKKGTEIKIKKENLRYEDGSPVEENAKIECQLKEIQSFGDQLFENIVTTSPEGILESGGMFQLNVFANDKKVTLKEGSSYEAKVPNAKFKDGMNVYTGFKNEQGAVAWKKQDSVFRKANPYLGPRPSICVEEKELAKVKYVPRLDSIYKNFDLIIPQMPQAPAALQKPREPRLPDINSKKYQIEWFQKLFISKEKSDYLKELKYETDYEKYLKRIERYEAKYEIYLDKLSKMEEKTKQYTEDMKRYKDSIKKCFEAIHLYRLATLEQYYANSVNNRIQHVVKQSKKDSFFNSNVLGYISEYNHLFKKLNLDSRYLNAVKKLANHNIFRSKKDRLQYGIHLEGYDFNLEMDFNNLVKENAPNKHTEVVAYLRKQQEDFYTRQVALGYVTKGQMLEYYTANLTSFNWINVDKFIGIPQEQFVEYKLDMDADLKVKDKKMFAIIPETNSTIAIYDNKVKLPSKYKAKIVAYYMDKDMKVHFCKKEVKKNIDTYSFDFQEKTLEEFKTILAAL